MPPSGKEGIAKSASVEIETCARGLSAEVTTAGLPAGPVVTLWWVVLQNPAECDPSPCMPKDGIGRWDAVDNVVTHGAEGVVAQDGKLKLSNCLPSGSVDQNWFGTTIIKPDSAEVHIVLNDHGPPIPGMAAGMLSSHRAGGKYERLPPIFPDTAKADGMPGPNGCRSRCLFKSDGRNPHRCFTTAPDDLLKACRKPDLSSAKLLLMYRPGQASRSMIQATSGAGTKRHLRKGPAITLR